MTSWALIFWAIFLVEDNALVNSPLGTVKEISVNPVKLTFWTIKSTLTPALEISVNILAAIPALSGTAQMVILASDELLVIPLTTTSSIFSDWATIMVPSSFE